MPRPSSRRSLLSAGLALGCGAWLIPSRPAAAQVATSAPNHGDMARVDGTTYASLASAHAAASPGGVIEILPGTHVGSKVAATIAKAITIRGVRDRSNVRPTLDLGTAAVQKAILNPSGASFVVEQLVLRGATTGAPTGNAAGLRPEPRCLSMISRFVDFIGCQNGVLTPTRSPGAIYLFEDCAFIECGNSGYAHSCYIGRAQRVTFRRTTSRDCVGGHDFKSRALETYFEDSQAIQSRSSSRALDLSNGGILKATRSRFIKPASSVMDELIGLKPETQHGSERPESYLFENCILDNQRPNGTVINNRSPVPAIVRACTLPGRTRMVGAVMVQP